MEITKEQSSILENLKKYKQIRINAFAGTGKTTTLQLIANHNQNKKILYLAFNSSIKNEAMHKFAKNVFVKTTHGIAFSAVKKNTTVELEKLVNYRAVDIAKKYDISYDQAVSALKIFEGFCNNTQESISQVDLEHKTAYDMFNHMLINKLLPTHGFYLKYYYLLLKSEQIPQYEYDIAMIDEAQDTNEVTLAIFDLLKAKTKVFVGDTHQQIYSFRGSKNILDKVKYNKSLNLSTSFRFNKKIATLANKLLKNFKNEKTRIKAFENNIEDIISKSYISRTNATLIDKIATRIEEKKPFVTIRDPKEIFHLTIEVYYLLNDEKKQIKRNIFLKEFFDEDDLSTYAKEVDDYELSSAIKVVKEHGEKIFEYEDYAIKFFKAWNNRANNGFEQRLHEILFLTTAHTSKGLQWDKVTIADDFIDFAQILLNLGCDDLESYKANSEKHLLSDKIDEFNLFYVAVTRAKKEINQESKNFYYLKSNSIEKTINRRIEQLRKDE